MRIVVLIIAGYDHTHTYGDRHTYAELQRLSRLYYRSMATRYDLRYFYLEYSESIDDDLVEQGDMLLLRGREEFDLIYTKTKRCMRHIQQTYDYDYVVRTNLSSFWNIHHLFALAHRLPTTRCLTGYMMFDSFISGTGIILSKDTCVHFLRQPDLAGPDDVAIYHNIAHYCGPFDLVPHYAMGWLIDGTNAIPEDLDHILYFRVKNADRANDVVCFKRLLRRLYQIDAPDADGA